MFYPTHQFSFTQPLCEAWRSIAEECRTLLAEEFTPWPETHLYTQGWQVYGLYFNGNPILENCVFCPVTTELVKRVPGMVTAGFSRLRAGCHIRPHIGYSDKVIRVHLTLESNTHCRLRVGHETKRWSEGECLVFNDRVEHEAWNEGDSDRTVLLLDVQREKIDFTGRAN
jgi:Aspartyl/asparaginyl beta-hydroxylase and related dioxygenases